MTKKSTQKYKNSNKNKFFYNFFADLANRGK